MRLVGCVVVVVIALGWGVYHVEGQAILIAPPGRSSMWAHLGNAEYAHRIKPNEDYVTNQNCGGQRTSEASFSSDCSPCGNADNEAPNGKYAIGESVWLYHEGDTLNVTIDVKFSTSTGTNTFKLCKTNSTTIVNHQCFVYSLTFANTAITDIPSTWPASGGLLTFPLKLPDGVTCNHCVLQWVWRNNGNGKQYTIANCADVSIFSKGTTFPDHFDWPRYDEYASIYAADGSDSHATTTASPLTTDRLVISTPVPTTSSPRTIAPVTTTQPITIPTTPIVFPPIITPPSVTTTAAPAAATTAAGELSTPRFVDGGGIIVPAVIGGAAVAAAAASGGSGGSSTNISRSLLLMGLLFMGLFAVLRTRSSPAQPLPIAPDFGPQMYLNYPLLYEQNAQPLMWYGQPYTGQGNPYSGFGNRNLNFVNRYRSPGMSMGSQRSNYRTGYRIPKRGYGVPKRSYPSASNRYGVSRGIPNSRWYRGSNQGGFHSNNGNLSPGKNGYSESYTNIQYPEQNSFPQYPNAGTIRQSVIPEYGSQPPTEVQKETKNAQSTACKCKARFEVFTVQCLQHTDREACEQDQDICYCST